MISVIDVLGIFISGFVSAKLYDYVKTLEKENEHE